MKLQDLKFIFIEAWHGGGTDNGAVWNWTTERAHTIWIAKAAAYFATQVSEFSGVQIIQIWVDENITLINKIKKINEISKKLWCNPNNSILVSIHVNSGGKWLASGVEWWFYTGNAVSQSLVDWVAKCQSELTWLKIRNTRGDLSNRRWRLWIIRDTKPLACLIECWFIDNPSDANLLKNPETEKKFWQGIIRWIKRFVWVMS